MLVGDAPFSLLDPLPVGHLAIEASAGTGKTYTLAGLAMRYVAEWGVSPSELLMVTFTRAATAELRGRVRQRLVEAASFLATAAPGDPVDDALLERLAAVDRVERERRLANLERAITDFDAAMVTTIHGFATQVLGSVGVNSPVELDATLVDDTEDLAVECCTDVLATVAGEFEASSLPTFSTLAKTVGKVLALGEVQVIPDPADADVSDDARVMSLLVRRTVDLLNHRRRAAGTMAFDDVLLQLRSAMLAPRGSAAIDALRARFRVALIDEFQDTDPVQWAVFRSLFGSVPTSGDDRGALVLVGDPKQAIYSFRGANVSTFLEATTPTSQWAVQRRTLDTNWRSDPSIIHATDLLLEGTTYGDERIAFAPVHAAETDSTRRIRDAAGAPLPSLSIRVGTGEGMYNDNGPKRTDPLASATWSDLVAQVVTLLDSGRIPADAHETDSDGYRPVRPSDIAVLLHSNSHAVEIQTLLNEAGIAAVLSRGGNVLDSPAAEQWRILIEALRRPADPRRARAFALSWFGGYDAQQLAASGDAEINDLQEQLHDWASMLRARGVSQLMRRLESDTSVAARVLALPDGDRCLTDLEHIAELLGSGTESAPASPDALLSVLDATTLEEPGQTDAERDPLSRRIESEDEAVQIMTVWVAKGLEFPIVCYPMSWRPGGHPPTIYQDPDTGLRTYDVASNKNWPDTTAARHRKDLAQAEVDAEAHRLAYVALTRARHHTIVWWAPVKGVEKRAISRILFARDEHGWIDPSAYIAEKFDAPGPDAADVLQPLVERSEGTIAVRQYGTATTQPRWSPADPSSSRSPLEVARFTRRPDTERSRWSFTAIAALDESDHHSVIDPFDLSGGDAGAADEADALPRGSGADAATDTDAGGAGDEVVPTGVSPLSGLPGGAEFGTLVHSVLEEVDFAAVDLRSEIAEALGEQISRSGFDPSALVPYEQDRTDASRLRSREQLVDGLAAALHTPLGPLFGGQSLSQISRSDRLDEMSFELLLAPGGKRVTVADIGAVIADHIAPTSLFDDDTLYRWARSLADGRLGTDLAGHLTGSIDAVLRVPAPVPTDNEPGQAEGTLDSPTGERHAPQLVPRYVVVDYKTNRLAPAGVANEEAFYESGALHGAMAASDYPLQGLLYSVALHRYLRIRQPDYDPGVHLGGIAYLFVRGMAGPDTPVSDGIPNGVFSWDVPSELVIELSDLLEGT